MNAAIRGKQRRECEDPLEDSGFGFRTRRINGGDRDPQRAEDQVATQLIYEDAGCHIGSAEKGLDHRQSDKRCIREPAGQHQRPGGFAREFQTRGKHPEKADTEREHQPRHRDAEQ